MTNKKDGKKILVKGSSKNSEEKWKGLENKVWVVAEFGYYVVLIAFTLLAVGFRANTLLNDRIRSSGSKYIESNYNTIYYNVSNNCNDLNNCMLDLNEIYQGEELSIHYESIEGNGILDVDGVSIETSPISELAILENGYIATFGEGNENYLVSYYNSNGELIKEYQTNLSSTGKLDSTVGIYATCNGDNLDVIKYSIRDGDYFDEELISSDTNAKCSQ